MDERLRRWTLAPNKSPRPVGFPPLHPACPASGDNIFLTLRHSRLPLVVQGPHLSTKLLVVSQVGQVRANNLSSESSTIKSVPPILSHRLQYCSIIIYLYRVCVCPSDFHKQPSTPGTSNPRCWCRVGASPNQSRR